MSVELAKVVNGNVAQRARFAVTRINESAWHLEVALHADGANRYALSADTLATEGEALAAAHHQVFSYFTAFTDAEMDGAEITWSVTARDGAPQPLLDLAQLIADGVEDYLAEEIEDQETEELRRRGEPISYGMLDYETGTVTPVYTEYPGGVGTPTKLVHADGLVDYIDEDGEPVDEQGHPIDREDGSGT